MRNKKGLLVGVVGVALVVGVAVAFYEFGMSDAAKASVKRAARTTKEGFESVRDVIVRTNGVQMDTQDPTANRQAVEQQWAKLGF